MSQDDKPDELTALMEAFANAHFDCGEWDGDYEEQPAYEALRVKADECKEKLLAYINGARSSGRLTKPAQVGNTVFRAGVEERLVIDRAHREFEYQQTPEKEAERLKRFDAFREAMGKAETDPRPVVVDPEIAERMAAIVAPSATLAQEPAAWLEIDHHDGAVIGVSREKDPFSPFRWEPVYRAKAEGTGA